MAEESDRLRSRSKLRGLAAPPGSAPSELEENAIRRLYRGDLANFVERRKEQAAILRAAGVDKPTVQEFLRLGKPNLSAWAVNQLYYLEPDRFAELTELGARLLTLQRARNPGEGGVSGVRSLSAQRRQVVDSLTEKAESLLQADGHGAARATLNHIRTSLEATSFRQASRDTPRAEQPGTLVRDLSAPDFDQLLGLGPVPAGTRGPGPNPIPAPPASGGKAPVAGTRAKVSLARKLKEQGLRAQIEKVQRQQVAAAEQVGILEGQRRLTERALQKEQRALDRLRERLLGAQQSRDVAARAHQTAEREHRRGELTLLQLQKRLEALRSELPGADSE